MWVCGERRVVMARNGRMGKMAWWQRRGPQRVAMYAGVAGILYVIALVAETVVG